MSLDRHWKEKVRRRFFRPPSRPVPVCVAALHIRCIIRSQSHPISGIFGLSHHRAQSGRSEDREDYGPKTGEDFCPSIDGRLSISRPFQTADQAVLRRQLVLKPLKTRGLDSGSAL